MIIYLTLNDGPSGIYNSQVIDVVKCLNTQSQQSIKLVSLISIRGFFNNKQQIRKQLPEALVLPMIPGFRNWKLNRFVLYWICRIYKPKAIIGRSVLAAYIALSAKKKELVNLVCHDGRGAIAAEWTEYNVVNNEQISRGIKTIEEKVVKESDYSIAVSEQLVEYWRSAYNYNSTNYIVIPCTLSNDFCDLNISYEKIQQLRSSIGYSTNDIVLVYSGSSAGWQSFEFLKKTITPLLNQDKNIKLLFLARLDKQANDFLNKYPNQVRSLWVDHKQVINYLLMGDYGLLIREQSITNKVASPVKFAEYLACGLSILISENIGDYTKFIIEHKCGYIIDYTFAGILKKVEIKDREQNIHLANIYFNKNSELNSIKYNKLMRILSGH